MGLLMRLAISPSSSSSSSSISNRAFISRILRRFVNFYRHKKRKKTRQLCHSTSNTYFNFERVNRGRNGPTLTHDNTHIGVNVSHQSATLDTSKFLFLLFRPTLPSIMMSYCLTPFFFINWEKWTNEAVYTPSRRLFSPIHPIGPSAGRIMRARFSKSSIALLLQQRLATSSSPRDLDANSANSGTAKFRFRSGRQNVKFRLWN